MWKDALVMSKCASVDPVELHELLVLFERLIPDIDIGSIVSFGI